MMSPTTLTASFALDLLLGDPEWLPHPVRLMGTVAGRLEAPARRFARNKRDEVWAGAFLTAIISGASFASAYLLLRSLRRRNNRLGKAIEIVLAWTTLALRNLLEEANTVIVAAAEGNLALARQRLARIVGRDTAGLDEQEIARAVIETVAESTCDGVIAPMFYLLLGGAPAALLFKGLSTLDSMFGHRDARYLYFGRVAARADDVANFLPARLTAAAIAIAACLSPTSSGQTALTTWKADGNKHSSPNAGHPEAAMAGALAVRLGGGNYYGGEFHRMPHLGAEFNSPTIPDARRSLIIAGTASLVAFAVCLAAALWREQ